MASGEDETSMTMKAAKRPKKASQPFHVIPYSSTYVDEDCPMFWYRLDTIYTIFEGYKRHYNMAWWAECCLCCHRRSLMDAVGYLVPETISITTFLSSGPSIPSILLTFR